MKSIWLILFLFFTAEVLAQKAEITGRVSETETGQSLPGVNVLTGPAHGVATDENGAYKILVDAGKIRLQFRFIGYQTLTKSLDLMPGEQLTLNIELQPETHLLNETVVSASRYEQKISDVIVSMEIINTAKIDNTHTLSIETALQQVPGVMFLDDQVSIRSGNGYSYGVGSRVLLLLDDLPMLTGAGGEAKWDFIPLENLAQVEVIKGASSALYGSSALNGVINVRTAWPEQKPQTNIMLYSGLYGQPKREEIAWWSKTPYYSGLRLSHSQMVGNLDIVAGMNLFKDEGYREGENEKTGRFNLNTRYRSSKVKGLSGGINMNAMFSEGGNFLLWLDGDTGVYRPAPTFDQYFKNTRFNLDPHLTYHTPNNGRHSLKGRMYQVAYDNDTIMYNHDDSYFAEYQYLKRWSSGWSLTAGASATYIYSNSNLFGNQKHDATNHSIYFQTERKFNKLSLSLGGRYEWHAINSERQKSRPLLRAGLNYQAAPYTFIRSSFGQGYRYPAIAEKYAATEAGAIKVFPNENLQPEYGWNAEIGLKQGFAFRDVQGYLDLAFFWSEYQNMIEFSFGQHYPDSITNPTLNQYMQYTGFKAFNISNARIAGFEINLIGQGKAGPLNYSFQAGYTYTDPVDKDFEKASIQSATTDINILKYRFYHGAKLSFDVGYGQFSTGINVDYHSSIINIDLAFQDSLRINNVALPIFLLPGLREYRENHNSGDMLFNWRIAWEPNAVLRWSFFINNLFNREYMTRPADVGPPRVFATQVALRL